MTDFDTRAREIAERFGFEDRRLPENFGTDLLAAISAALKEAVEGEREACAKICDDPEGRFTAFKDSVSRLVAQMTASAFADAIRSRKEP